MTICSAGMWDSLTILAGGQSRQNAETLPCGNWLQDPKRSDRPLLGLSERPVSMQPAFAFYSFSQQTPSSGAASFKMQLMLEGMARD